MTKDFGEINLIHITMGLAHSSKHVVRDILIISELTRRKDLQTHNHRQKAVFGFAKCINLYGFLMIFYTKRAAVGFL